MDPKMRPDPGHLGALMSVLDGLGIGFYRSDADGRILLVNEAGLRIYGYSAEDLPLKVTAQDTAWNQEDWSRVRDQVREFGSAGPFVAIVKKKDGGRAYLEFSLHGQSQEGEPFAGIEGVFRDVTPEVVLLREQAALTEASRKTHAHLAALSALQEDLLFSLSHDLKTPPVVIQGFAELLMRGRYGALSPEQEKPTQTIYRNILALSDMVDQLLDFSRLLKKIHAHPGPASLSRAWMEACEGFGKLGHVLATFAPCRVEGHDLLSADGTGLAYALRNIASNALRFAKPGTEISSSVRREGDMMRLEVVIPELLEDHPSIHRLLDSFFQPSTAAQAEAGISVPGLSAGRYLATLMGGELTGEELGPDQGRLILRLPAAG